MKSKLTAGRLIVGGTVFGVVGVAALFGLYLQLQHMWRYPANRPDDYESWLSLVSASKWVVIAIALIVIVTGAVAKAVEIGVRNGRPE